VATLPESRRPNHLQLAGKNSVMENTPNDKKPPNHVLYWILGGGFGCSILGICLIGGYVIGAIALIGDPQPTKFTGS
jgi:hypothetical protein